jgi:hypothetical protein
MFKRILVSALILTGCNLGIFDIQKEHKTCYDKNVSIGKENIKIDSTAKDCSDTYVTSPFDDLLNPKKW